MARSFVFELMMQVHRPARRHAQPSCKKGYAQLTLLEGTWLSGGLLTG